MHLLSVAALVGLVAYVAAYSLELWTNPGAFLRKRREARARAYRSSLGWFINNPYSRGFDRNPALELWLARVGFGAMYVFIAFLLFLSLRP